MDTALPEIAETDRSETEWISEPVLHDQEIAEEIPIGEQVPDAEQAEPDMEPYGFEAPAAGLAEEAQEPDSEWMVETTPPKTTERPAEIDLLALARQALSEDQIPDAIAHYSGLIKQKRELDSVIEDLNDALYRLPVETTIWETLGDAFLKADRLQDALDAYTKAEDLLR